MARAAHRPVEGATSAWDEEVASLIDDAALVAELGDGLTALLSAATAPASADELRGESFARIAFRAANHRPTAARDKRRSRPTRRVGHAAVVLGSVATLMVSTTGLAAAGALPTPAEHAVARAIDDVGLDIGPLDTLQPPRPTLPPSTATSGTPAAHAVTATGVQARAGATSSLSRQRTEHQRSSAKHAPATAATAGVPAVSSQGSATAPSPSNPPPTTPPSGSPPGGNPPPGGSHGPPPGGSHGPPPGGSHKPPHGSHKPPGGHNHHKHPPKTRPGK